MLNATLQTSYVAAWNNQVALLGQPVTWEQAAPPNATKSIVAGFKTVGVKDEATVNAYGMGARIITIRAGDLPVAPEKFDRITVGGETDAIEDVQPVHLGGTLLGWRCFIKGK